MGYSQFWVRQRAVKIETDDAHPNRSARGGLTPLLEGLWPESRREAMETVWLSVTVCALAILLATPRAIAEDTSPAKTGVAIPSVEELAMPNGGLQKADDATDGGTREAICLMIESAARANDL